MTNRLKGFTLIELMIVVALIAIIASIAIPNLLTARINANEACSISTLRSVCTAQQQIRTSGAIDCNLNGQGEHGYFAELSGRQGVRTGNPDAGGASVVGPMQVSPPVMSQAFGEVNASGHVVRSGYVFRLSLPGTTRDFLHEQALSVAPPVSPVNAEILWCCYAWPVTYGNSGKRAFFVNQQGEVLATSNQIRHYSGTGTSSVAPSGVAAFRLGATSMSNSLGVASGPTSNANDGQVWTVVN